MRVKLLMKKRQKILLLIHYNLLRFILVILLPLYIKTNYTTDISVLSTKEIINTQENIIENGCDIGKYLKRECEYKIEDDTDKRRLKEEFYNKIDDLTPIFDEIKRNKKDIIIHNQSETYHLFYYNTQKYQTNLTYIDCSKCIDDIFEQYGGFMPSEFFIFKIEQRIPEFKIPYIEFILFTPPGPQGMITFSKGVYYFCNNTNIKFSIPVTDINDKILLQNNFSSEYYKDDCSQYPSSNGIDMPIFSRKNDYSNNINIHFCEINCNYLGYNPVTSRVECDCQWKGRYNNDINLDNNFYRFDAEPKISNFYVLKCYYLITSVNDIKKNPGFYLTAIVLLFFIIIFFIFLFKGYGDLKKRIDLAIKMKFYPNNNVNNDKCIVVGLKNNNDSNARNDKIRKKSARVNNKSNFGGRSNSKRISKKNNSKSKNMSLGSKSGIFSKKDAGGKLNKTYDEFNIDDDNVYIFENDYEFNMLPFQKAEKCDKRTFGEFYMSFLRNKQLLLFSFCDYNSYNSSIVKKSFFFLALIYNYGINAFFLTEDVMDSIYQNNGSLPIKELLIQVSSSSLVVTALLRLIIEFLFLTEKNILNVKKQKTEEKAKEEKEKALKIICIKFVFFFFVNILLLVFFLFYLTCFNALYPNTQIMLLIDTTISFGLYNIYPCIYCIIPAFFRNDILNQKKRNKKAKPKTEAEKKEDEYVYSVSQVLLQI